MTSPEEGHEYRAPPATSDAKVDADVEDFLDELLREALASNPDFAARLSDAARDRAAAAESRRERIARSGGARGVDTVAGTEGGDRER